MLNACFVEIMDGRMKRLPVIGYMCSLSSWCWDRMGVADNLVGGDLTKTQQMLAEKFGLPVMLHFGIAVEENQYELINIIDSS